MGSLRVALAVSTVAVIVIVTGCATTPLPPPSEAPAPMPGPLIGPLIARSLPVAHRVAMIGIGAVGAMSAKSASAALRPAAAEHVLWKPSSIGLGAPLRRPGAAGSGTGATPDSIARE